MPAELQPAQIDELVARALRRRADLLPRLAALRLVNDRGDGLEGLVIERLGPVLIAQLHEGRLCAGAETLRPVCERLAAQLGASAVYRKTFPRDRSRALARLEAQLTDPAPWIGAAARPEIVIDEDGLRLIVRPYDGYSTGLFLEHRDNRALVRRRAAGRRVLNLFAYTCGFSVAALAGGAAEVVSVDLSRKFLDWGRRNLLGNLPDRNTHAGEAPAGDDDARGAASQPSDARTALESRRAEFVCSDAFEYYRRAARQGRRFDLVILDPPTFSRQKHSRRVFSIERDLDRLVRGAVELLDRGGVLLLCCNHRATTPARLAAAARAAAGARLRRPLETPGLPADFRGDPDYARSLWAWLD
ncbi:MAG TPA: class I SAM-dependent methyltransferase [Phycisphaerae bacterium]|nr:class I SAM-dependent methyltransferase [Phycisphaerae bacterium]